MKMEERIRIDYVREYDWQREKARLVCIFSQTYFEVTKRVGGGVHKQTLRLCLIMWHRDEQHRKRERKREKDIERGVGESILTKQMRKESASVICGQQTWRHHQIAFNLGPLGNILWAETIVSNSVGVLCSRNTHFGSGSLARRPTSRAHTPTNREHSRKLPVGMLEHSETDKGQNKRDNDA